MRPQRKNPRLTKYDYSAPGYYFVTTCTYERQCVFGAVVGAEMALSPLGLVVERCWQQIPERYPAFELDVHVIMPNHLHGLLFLRPHSTEHSEEQSSKRASLGNAINAFKAGVTKQRNMELQPDNTPVWQRNYYERVVRDEDELFYIRRYIQENPMAWELDKENPARRGPDPMDAWLANR